MTDTFTLTFNMDGAEGTRSVIDATGEASAVAVAKDAFKRAISRERPKEAYCAVCTGEGDGAGAEPLGLWHFRARRRPELIWEPAKG